MEGYKVLKDGTIIGKRGNPLRQCESNCGYMQVTLLYNRKKVNKTVHRLVAETHICNPDQFPVVNHKDGNKKNNNVSNLEWTTRSRNIIHSFELGLNNNQTPVSMYKDGIIVQSFRSTREAQRSTGIDHSDISKTVRGLIPLAGGYSWRVKNAST